MIYIIGRGAIGKALAVFLKLNKKDVVVLRGSVHNEPSHPEKFEVTLSNSDVLNAEVEVSSLRATKELRGIVVVTNKSFGNREVAEALRGKTGNSPLVILQNGLGVEQPFLDNDFPSVYRCVLFVTSQNLGATGVRFKPVSPCPVGIMKGSEKELQQIVADLTTVYFQFRTEAKIEYLIWRKAIINCAFNSICPLLEIDNGVFHRNQEALGLARRVVEECSLIARKKGVDLDVDDVIGNLLLISKSSDGQLISTLQDIRAGQPTEIDTLNFEVARIAESFGMIEQVRETKMLGELTRLKSSLNQGLDHRGRS
ncbi:MAG TPA: ketopantoate reductase C-terminal domain-containing protein [Cyclobacteriaceae bacterium]|nr:ketopantoate reductase C-terminal domain-containing protein [Cyclobacteriaceae bacterium]